MQNARKDCKGRILRKGESQRKSDKRYIYQYTDGAGKRRVVYANDLPELREKEQKLLRDQLDGLRSYSAGKATLNSVFDRYISTKFDIKAHTKTHYQYMYDHFVRETLGKRSIVEIKYSDIKFFYHSLMSHRKVSIASVSTVHTILHPTFEMAVRDDIIRSNPTNGVLAEIRKSDGKGRGKRHALTLEQQRAFLSYVAESPAYCQWMPLFTVFFGTGCRMGEVLGLRWKDLDYEKRLISINHTVVYVCVESHRRKFHVSTPKTEAGVRLIPMMDTVMRAFQSEYETQKETGFNTQVVDGMSGFIFCTKDGKIPTPQVINKNIRRIYKAYNDREVLQAAKEHRPPLLIPDFTCHHIRHTFCTRFCEKETNLKVIQSIMGHANIQTTMDIYAEATEGKKREAIKALENDSDIF